MRAFVVESVDGNDLLLEMPEIEKFGGKLTLCGKTFESIESKYFNIGG